MYLVYDRQNQAYMEQCALDGVPTSECSLIDKLVNDFKSCNFIYIGLMIVCFTLSNISRAIRWNMLFHTLGYKPKLSNSFLTITLSYFANLGLSRGGEVIRAASMAKYEKMSSSQSMGTVVLDRVFDMVVFLVAIVLAFIFGFQLIYEFIVENLSKKFENMQSLLTLMWVLIAVSILGGIFLWRLRKYFRNLKFYGTIKKKVKSFLEGLRTYKHVENKGMFWFHTFFIWVCFFFMTYFAFFAYEPTSHLGFREALMVFVFGSLGVIIPTPGGMGTYHFLVSTALILYHVDKVSAFSFANIVFFTIQIFYCIVLGVISIILLPIINKGYVPAKPVHVSHEENHSN